MKKIIFAIFAHPDDESFGPSGTLLLESHAGAEVHLITLTCGDSGMNPDNCEDLGKVRLAEWRAAGKLIGVHAMHYLGYSDGQLCNRTMIEVSQRITDLISDIIVDQPDDIEIEFMSNDLNGITGHIDHIVAARAACFVFYTLKERDTRVNRLRLACITRGELPDVNLDWLYMEPGRTNEEVDETIDASHVREELKAIIRAHHTQRSDGEAHIKKRADRLGVDSFIVKR